MAEEGVARILMEPSREYWTLHEWLFKAYDAGLKANNGVMPKAICMTWFIGPDWREVEKEGTPFLAQRLESSGQ